VSIDTLSLHTLREPTDALSCQALCVPTDTRASRHTWVSTHTLGLRVHRHSEFTCLQTLSVYTPSQEPTDTLSLHTFRHSESSHVSRLRVLMRQHSEWRLSRVKTQSLNPHEKLLGITRVSIPVTRKDLADRTWGVFWYSSKIPVLFEIIVQIKQKRGTGVKNPSPRSFWCGVKIQSEDSLVWRLWVFMCQDSEWSEDSESLHLPRAYRHSAGDPWQVPLQTLHPSLQPTKSRNSDSSVSRRYRFKLKFWLTLNLYRGIWVSRFDGFWRYNIVSWMCRKPNSKLQTLNSKPLRPWPQILLCKSEKRNVSCHT